MTRLAGRISHLAARAAHATSGALGTAQSVVRSTVDVVTLTAVAVVRAPTGVSFTRNRHAGAGARTAWARALAARRVEPLEIARRTGLSHDAVAMLLSAPARRAQAQGRSVDSGRAVGTPLHGKAA